MIEGKATGSGRKAAPLDERLEIVADQLLDLARDLKQGRPEMAVRESYDGVDTLRIAETIYANRRHRDEMFGSDLFGEPAWDILLSLFIATGKNQLLALKAVSMDAGVPQTTVQRWLEVLEKKGMVRRFTDTGDKRRTCVDLTASAHAQVHKYLEYRLNTVRRAILSR